MSVALEADIVNDATAAFILSRAQSRALSLAGQLDSNALDDELRASLVGAASTSTDAVPSETATAEEAEAAAAEEEEEVEEDAGFGGLGDLFG